MLYPEYLSTATVLSRGGPDTHNSDSYPDYVHLRTEHYGQVTVVVRGSVVQRAGASIVLLVDVRPGCNQDVCLEEECVTRTEARREYLPWPPIRRMLQASTQSDPSGLCRSRSL